MICANCGTQNRAGRRFCAECGASLSAACRNCGAANEPGEKFCGECGTPLAAAQTAGPSANPASPTGGIDLHRGVGSGSTSVPGRSGVGAERRLVSVLFADLVGFTSLSEARDPEDVRELLSRYFEVARDVIGRYGGVIEKFIGDAVMAVWGTPVAHEDDAERAVRAALELVEGVSRLGAEVGATDLALRAGVLTGEAAVTLGAEGQGMVAGDLVNTASRLQSVAPPGSVLVGESTYRAAQEAIAFEPVGEQAFKGKALPVPAWQALRVVAQRGGIGRSEVLEPPFVGRDDELQLLKDQLAATGREQRPRLLSVVGIAGIGKSRLAWEFLKYIDGVVETVYWHHGRCPAYGEGVSFWALAEMVRERARIAETDDPQTTREKLAAAVTEHVTDEGERRWIEPRLAALLGLEDVAAREREELFTAWRTFFQRVAASDTTVLLFEDLQWADSGLLDFIEHLLEWSRTSPILVVTLARPELFDRRATWGAGQRNFTNLRLEPLPERAMHELLSGMVPGLPEDVRARVVARAEGIPLYAVETVRMLLARGVLRQDDGRYSLTGDVDQLDVPESLHAVIAARLDALDPDDRRLLQDAAVLGQTFTVGALASVRGDDPGPLEPRLRGLVRRELLVLETDPRSPERGQYGFVQALVREVAYNTLSRRDRRARHLSAARHFESLADDTLTGAVASHFLEAYRAGPEGEEGEAVAFQARRALRAAAERAAALGSYEQAIGYLEQALSTATDPDERAQLSERAGALAEVGGEQELAQRYLRAAIDHYRARGDLVAVARSATHLTSALLASGLGQEAIAVAEDAVHETAGLDHEPEAARLMAELARAYMRSETPAKALDWAERALIAAEQLALVDVVAEALVTRATAIGQFGRRQEATVLMRGVLQLAEARGLTTTEIRLRINLSLLLLEDDPAAALAVAQLGLQLVERLGLRTFASYLVGNATDAAWRTGDWAWALETIEDWMPRMHDPFDEVAMLQSAALIRACRGDISEAELDDIESRASGLSDPLVEVNNFRTRAWFAFARGDWSDAASYATSFAGRVEILVAPSLVLVARSALAQGDLAAARSALERLAPIAVRTAAGRVDQRTIAAGVAAAEARTAEAVEEYRAAMQGWRDLGLAFDLALCALDFVTFVGPAHPEADAAGGEAEQIFEQLGAAPFLARVRSARSAGVERPTA